MVDAVPDCCARVANYISETDGDNNYSGCRGSVEGPDDDGDMDHVRPEDKVVQRLCEVKKHEDRP